MAHVCPWWGGYFIDNPLRRLLHNPERILGPHVSPGMTALDFGCGMGVFAIPLARMVGAEGRVTAVDLQAQMLAVVRRRAARAGVDGRVATHQCEADALKLDGRFDFALAFYSAHETPDMGRLFRELHERLRPGGSLLLVEPIGHVTKSGFQRMLESAGESGMRVEGRPRVRLSHAALLRKG